LRKVIRAEIMKIIIQLKAENTAEVVISSFIPQRKDIARSSKKMKGKSLELI
jgi:hypothetical protein